VKDVDLSHLPAPQIFAKHTAVGDARIVDRDRVGVFPRPAPCAFVGRDGVGHLPRMAGDGPKRASTTRVRQGDTEPDFGGLIEPYARRAGLRDKCGVDRDAQFHLTHEAIVLGHTASRHHLARRLGPGDPGHGLSQALSSSPRSRKKWGSPSLRMR